MNKNLLLFLALILLTACIYETPQATQISSQAFNSTQDTFAQQEELKEKEAQQFTLKRRIDAEYTAKAAENIHDECKGCLDIIAASASAIRYYDPSLTYPAILSLSGALRLDEREKLIHTFLTHRVSLLGYEPFYTANQRQTSKAAQVFRDAKNKPARVGIADANYLKALLFSGAIPIASIDRFYIFEDQLGRYLNISGFKAEHEEIFVALVGYKNEIFIHDPRVDGLRASYQKIDLQHFSQAWASDQNTYGIQFSFYLLKKKPMIGGEQASKTIIEDITYSHQNLRSNHPDLESIILQGYITRKEASMYFKDTDKEIYQTLKQSASLFKALIGEKNKNTADQKLNEIIQTEQQLP